MERRVESSTSDDHDQQPKRSAFLWLALLLVLANSSWAVYHLQYERHPMPLTAEQVGKRGFSEVSAMEHVKSLTKLGPHPVGSDTLDIALQYVLAAAEDIKGTAHWDVNVEVDFFHSKRGINTLAGGLFKGKTLVYSDLKHVIMRISPRNLIEAEENAILVSSHIDTVFSTEGAGDCSSCVAVMLELARGVSHWAHGFRNSIVFLFNTGEEEGLNGAHSFITQHPWRSTIRVAVDLEAMGIGGKSSIFQAGPDPWALENFAKVAKYPSGNIIAQDLFLSGAIKSATDFQVYKEVTGLSGLDFAYADATAVYHTKNDKLLLLKPGSLQHLGENMLAFLRQAATSSLTQTGMTIESKEDGNPDQSVYFDILGSYMVVYRKSLAYMLQNSVIMQALLILAMSLFVGGYPAVISLGLSLFSLLLMWIFSLSFSVLVAFLLPHYSSPAPYASYPWLVVGLFGAPALLGAFTGQHLGYLTLLKYLSGIAAKYAPRPPAIQADLIRWEAERWIFKSGFLQWLIILIVGNFYKVGSSYVALLWLISPAFAYGLMEATLSPARLPKKLKIVTLVFGLAVPVLVSAGIFIRLMGTITGTFVRFETNPGTTPEWLGNVIVAGCTSSIVCLTLVYLLSYAHVSGNKKSIFLSVFAFFGLTLAAIGVGIFFPFANNVPRAVNVVHVVESTGAYGEKQNVVSYVSLFSLTPGKLSKEAEIVKDEGFVCGDNQTIDMVSFTVKYGCQTFDDVEGGWSESEIPTLVVESDSKADPRTTVVSIDTQSSSRWSLAINVKEIEDFKLEGDNEEIIPVGTKTSILGWHIIQHSGGKDAPKRFKLTLIWFKNSTNLSNETGKHQFLDPSLLLKLRTDVNRVTPKAAKVLEKLPVWCSLFGKSTSPFTLAFLTSLPVAF
ncbi:hypothetical protein H6P81_011724 [Aristolochia fimbriata]|uniref:Vacuolar membrane protease n=1 Tax=Aristolochia fimbriata TaxID=158543 RepID=A0AAV7EB23_ARIFI|nr:hypothetical protein H6P81_011724 [Aristolochia fimbriata]